MSRNYRFQDYAFKITPLSEEDGGGFLITFPDLPGCMSDGESVEEAIVNGQDAFEQWVAVQREEKREMPVPGAEAEAARFVQRLPRYIHQKLSDAARQEGVSVNTLVTTFVAEGLVARESTLTKGVHLATTSFARVETIGGTFLSESGGTGFMIATPVVDRDNVVAFRRKKRGEDSVTAANTVTPLYGGFPSLPKEK